MDKMLAHAMTRGSKKEPKPRHLKEFHAKEQHDGTYHVKAHSGKPNEPAKETSAADLQAVQAALENHMGTPNQGEAEAEPQPGMGGQVDPSMGAGQPGMGGQ